jgi:hypothetical protein
MKPLYDKYCSDGKILFAIGETGNGWEGPIEDRLGWLDQCTSAETAKAMPHLIGVVSPTSSVRFGVVRTSLILISLAGSLGSTTTRNESFDSSSKTMPK